MGRGRNRRKRKPPKVVHKVAWCSYHDIYMNWWFVHKRHCVVWKNCRFLYWCDADGTVTDKLNDKPDTVETPPEECEGGENYEGQAFIPGPASGTAGEIPGPGDGDTARGNGLYREIGQMGPPDPGRGKKGDIPLRPGKADA